MQVRSGRKASQTLYVNIDFYVKSEPSTNECEWKRILTINYNRPFKKFKSCLGETQNHTNCQRVVISKDLCRKGTDSQPRVLCPENEGVNSDGVQNHVLMLENQHCSVWTISPSPEETLHSPNKNEPCWVIMDVFCFELLNPRQLEYLTKKIGKTDWTR